MAMAHAMPTTSASRRALNHHKRAERTRKRVRRVKLEPSVNAEELHLANAFRTRVIRRSVPRDVVATTGRV